MSEDDRILLIDDFLAKGNALLGLLDVCQQSGATVVGAGIAIEKGFQEGGQLLRKRGLRVESSPLWMRWTKMARSCSAGSEAGEIPTDVAVITPAGVIIKMNLEEVQK